MQNIFVELISELTVLTKEEKIDIENSFKVKTFQKGAYVQKINRPVYDSFFVVKGLVRQFKSIGSEERTIDLFTENQPILSLPKKQENQFSETGLICLEQSNIGIINLEKEKALYKKHPRFETFCREGFETMMNQRMKAMTDLFVMSPEQRYRKILEERPDLLNRVPQYYIASYIGIKPETLSRIRKRIAG